VRDRYDRHGASFDLRGLREPVPRRGFPPRNSSARVKSRVTGPLTLTVLVMFCTRHNALRPVLTGRKGIETVMTGGIGNHAKLQVRIYTEAPAAGRLLSVDRPERDTLPRTLRRRRPGRPLTRSPKGRHSGSLRAGERYPKDQ